jgi:signal transduction histidine kinase
VTSESVKIFNKNIFLFISLAVILALTLIDLERSREQMWGYFFVIPVIVSYFTERSRTILLVAAIATIASLYGFFFAPVGINSNIMINRPFSLIVVWTVALLGAYQVRANVRIEEDRNRLRTILDTLPVGVATSDSKGLLEETNAQMDKIWDGRFARAQSYQEFQSYVGYRPGTEVRLKPEEWPMARSVNRGESVWEEVVDIERSDGKRGTLMISSAPIRNDVGDITGSVMVAMDITSQKQIEKELAEKAEGLARSNKELQQFAYVASHDLKEPLRMVTSYVQLLDHRYGVGLNDEAKEYIGFAVEGSRRMYALVEDLLTYSHMERSILPLSVVDMDQVMSTTLKDLKEEVESTGATITMDHLPCINADLQQMVQLMENLVGNAVKFHRSEPPVVHVSASMNGNEWLFSVKDNGIGIGVQYSEKVFHMFQRLNSREMFPGTGIGLAICKKVVERHGGRIWFESVPGEGTTFFFTLSAKASGPQILNFVGPLSIIS